MGAELISSTEIASSMGRLFIFTALLLLLATGTFLLLLEGEKPVYWVQPAIYYGKEVDHQDILEERKNYLKTMCKAYKLDQGNVNQVVLNTILIISNELQLGYCPIAKSGSSTWVQNFRALLNIPESIAHKWNTMHHYLVQSVGSLPKDLRAEDKMLLLESKMMFLFVRHPFDRVLSAYLDKVVDQNYHNWRGKTLMYNRVRNITADHIPTFDQFVNYVNSGREDRDYHLMSFTATCDPCHINYDIIGKLETAVADNQFILEKSGLGSVLDPHKKLHENRQNISHHQEKLQYFAQLSQAQLDSLYNKYYYDFRLFGYDKPYLAKSVQNKTIFHY